jgi:hypothetical protein
MALYDLAGSPAVAALRRDVRRWKQPRQRAMSATRHMLIELKIASLAG